MRGLLDLDGKIAVVTGGSRGLGRAMAEAFAAHGANVVIASRKVEACEATAHAISASTGKVVLGTRYHAGRWDEAEALLEFVLDRLGRIDVLVNNAGMSPLYESLTDISEALFDKVMAVNFKGPFRLSALVGERMASDGGGSIINISSVASVQPTPRELVYASAKAALDAMTTALALAYAPTVRVNTIMPGAFLTDISKSWDLDAFELNSRHSIALQRGGQPSEIAGAALYLASESSSYTTGAVIRVDGGMKYPP